MREYYICHACGCKMRRCIEDCKYSYNGMSVIVSDVEVFKCDNCCEAILTSQEVKRVEEAVLEKANKRD